MANPTPPIPPRGPGGKSSGGADRLPHKPVARKPGHVLDTPGEQSEEHVPELEAQRAAERMLAQQILDKSKAAEVKKARPGQEDSEQEKQRRGRGHGRGGRDGEPQGEPMKAGTLANAAAWQKSSADSARDHGFQQTPGIAEIVKGLGGAKAGESLAELLPGARMRAHPALPEPDMRPPVFLSPLESMTDIYMRTRGRMSRRTKELLESTELEDMIGMLARLFDDEELVRKAEARLLHPIHSKLKDDPGPLLLGLNDPRLTELWRLFLDRWEIWVPEDVEEKGGVELFWEGEAEDDDGEPIEILQALTHRQGELILFAKLGPLEDRIIFDGDTFYRLKSV